MASEEVRAERNTQVREESAMSRETTVRLLLRIGTVSILVGLAFYGGALGGFPGIAGVAVSALVGGWAALEAQHRGARR